MSPPETMEHWNHGPVNVPVHFRQLISPFGILITHTNVPWKWANMSIVNYKTDHAWAKCIVNDVSDHRYDAIYPKRELLCPWNVCANEYLWYVNWFGQHPLMEIIQIWLVNHTRRLTKWLGGYSQASHNSVLLTKTLHKHGQAVGSWDVAR